VISLIRLNNAGRYCILLYFQDYKLQGKKIIAFQSLALSYQEIRQLLIQPGILMLRGQTIMVDNKIILARQDFQWLHLWGKKDKTALLTTDCRYHPWLCRMLDVVAVASFVWDPCLSLPLCRRIEQSLGTDASAEIVFLSGAQFLGNY